MVAARHGGAAGRSDHQRRACGLEEVIRVADVAFTRAVRLLILAIPDTAAEPRESLMEAGFVSEEAPALPSGGPRQEINICDRFRLLSDA